MNDISKVETLKKYDSKILIKVNTTESLFVTLLTIIFFICFNPFYALVFTSIVNIFSKRIEFKSYAFLFSLSFALLFTNRDPATGGDVRFYIIRYLQNNTNIFDSIFNGVSEPIWTVYDRFSSILTGGSIDLYVLLTYFILFLLLATLAKLISRDKFVIVLFTMIFFNLFLLYGIFQIWRNTFAVLLLFIGLYSLRGRILVYLSPLVQLVTLPFLLIVFKINYKTVLIYITIGIVLAAYIYGKFVAFSGSKEEISTNLYFIAIALMIMTLRSLKFIKLNYFEKKIFIAMIVFILLPFLLNSEVPTAFSILYQRISSIFMFFGSIMVAIFIIKNQLISASFICTYFVYRFWFSFKNPDTLHNLVHIGDEKPLYIYNGIYLLINSYESNRWSEYIINNFNCATHQIYGVESCFY